MNRITRIARTTLALTSGVLFFAACTGNNASGPNAQSQPTQTAAGADVVNAGDGVRLGSGWFPVEHYHGLTFRWSANDAEVTACPDANNRTLALLLQPGPGTGDKSAPLAITGNRGDRLVTTLRDRQYVKIAVRPDVPAETFVLHVQSRNLSTPNDKRTLNFRALNVVLGSSSANCKNDVIDDGSPLAIGTGWNALETYGGQTFRWVDHSAQLRLTAAKPAPFTVEIDVAPGPSLGEPLRLSLANAQTGIHAQASPVAGPGYVTFTLPASAAGTTFTLSAPSKELAVTGDPRKLGFRVFNAKIKP